MKISLCSVVYNEEHRIKKFLDEASLVVDEIVLVNQASTDNTTDEAFEWLYSSDFDAGEFLVVQDQHWGYCEPSRIKAHDASSGDWILVLDADERVSQNTINLIADIRAGRVNTTGYRLKRSLWVSGIHYWTGDYQYRLFQRNAVRYLAELHTEPQPLGRIDKVSAPDFVGIWHEKSWVEQIRDENAYTKLIKPNDKRRDAKLALNVYSRMLEEAGLTPEEADKLAEEGADLTQWGIAPTHEPHEEIE